MTSARLRLTGAIAVAAILTSSCTTSVPGRAVRAGGRQPGPATARELLLPDGEDTPLGRADVTPVGDNYFTRVRQKECSAALLFKGSPLHPPGARDFAESAYRFGGPATYAESVNLYDQPLNPHAVAWSAFGEVSECRGDAVGESRNGEFRPMRVSEFGAPQDDVMTWAMSASDWTCSYGLAAVTKVVLLMVACDSRPGFPMAQWAANRKAQLDSRTA